MPDIKLTDADFARIKELLGLLDRLIADTVEAEDGPTRRLHDGLLKVILDYEAHNLADEADGSRGHV